MLINHQLPALYNGVSQQPAPLRLPSQAELQVNGWSTVVDGLRKRPPTQHVVQVATTDLSTTYLHVINRDTTERYLVSVSNGDLKVYDLLGNSKTVSFPHGKGYLSSGSPTTDFHCVSVADYTFVSNKSKSIAMKAVAADQAAQPTSYYWLNKSMRGADIGVNGFGAFTRQYGVNPSGTFQGSLQDFANLPKTTDPVPPSEGDIWQISGDVNSSFATYYVIRQGGVWNETVKPGLQNAIDETTMPWALVRKADGTFDFSPFSWKPRVVGDETTVPNPSFVGRAIRAIFFTKNRLGFTSDENVILSAAGDFGNFYRLTAVQLLADSVVDVGASETSVTKLNFAVPFQTGMMMFSDQAQFRFVWPVDGQITPTTVALDVATSYLSSVTVQPLQLGSDIYFISEDEAFAHIREYYVKQTAYLQTATTADDVGAHVPKFVPKGVYMLAGSNLQDCLFCSTASQPNIMFLYQFHWNDEQTKSQSAWSYWDLGSGVKVVAAVSLDDFLYVVLVRGGKTYIEKVSIALGSNAGLTDSQGNLYDILLDRRASVVGTYTGAPSNFTTFTLPYPYTSSGAVQMVQGADGVIPGALIDPSTYSFPTSTSVRVPGNVTGHVFAGEKYTFTYQFSEQFMKNQQQESVLSGTLTLKNFTVYFKRAACFSTVVDPYGNGNPNVLTYVPSEVYLFEGLNIGESSLVLGSPAFVDGSFTFGVYGDSKQATIQLVNDTPYNANFESAEWEAEYTNRSRTI